MTESGRGRRPRRSWPGPGGCTVRGRLPRADEALRRSGRRPRGRRPRPRRPGRLGLRAARAERRRQDDDPAPDHRARPADGRIASTIDGVDRSRRRIRRRRRAIGVLDQDPRYYGWMTGRELVELAGPAPGPDEPDGTDARATTTLSAVGLADAARRRVERLLGRDAPAPRDRPGARRSADACSSSTSRSARSTRRAGATSSRSSPTCGRAPRSSSRPMSSPTSSGSATGSGSWIAAGWSPRARSTSCSPATRCRSIRIDAGARPGRGARARSSRRCATPPGSIGVTDDGPGRLVVSVTDEGAASAGLLPLVVAAGVRLAAFERVRPTLEDVFLRLVGRDPGEAAGDDTTGAAA